jgi:hypothetical protein
LKIENLPRWLTLAANLGVLVGIVLVSLELRQSLTAVRAQTRHDVSAGFVDFMRSIAENPELASIRRRGDLGEDLSAEERYRYEAFTRGLFRYWENVHYQFRTNLYDLAEFARQREAWRSYAAASPGAVRWWCAHESEFSDEFAVDYSGLLPDPGCR